MGHVSGIRVAYWAANGECLMELAWLRYIHFAFEVSLLSILIAVPLGVSLAFFVAEWAPTWAKSALRGLLEFTVSVPGVVYAIWGVLFALPVLRTLDASLRFRILSLPWPAGPFRAPAQAAAVIVLVAMVIPTVAEITYRCFATVPKRRILAATALGATRWQAAWEALISDNRRTVAAAALVALGRAIGEVVVVFFVLAIQLQNFVAIFPGSALTQWLNAMSTLKSVPVSLPVAACTAALLAVIAVVSREAGKAILRRQGFAGQSVPISIPGVVK